ncbi:MAG: hypothetical protein AAFR58_24935 [Cyanobacteria bacterium J06627_28]
MQKNAVDLPEYSTFGKAIRSLCQNWCEAHGYSDPFLQDGEWWAFPPGGVMPVRVKTVMGTESQRTVRIGPLRVTLFPDGSLA